MNYYLIFIYLLILILISILIFKMFTYEKFSNNKNEMMTNLMNNIYCINLKKSKQRYNTVVQQFNAQNININRFEAVDGFNLEKQTLLDKNIISPNLKFNSAVIGCYLSHLKLWNQLKKNNIKYAIIIEDDIILSEGFKENLKNILETQMPSDFDIVYLGGNRICGSKIKKNVIKPDIHKCKKKNVGTFAYIISQKAYLFLLEKCNKPIEKMIDHTIRNYFNELNVYYIVPQLINHDYTIESIRRYNKINKKYGQKYIDTANNIYLKI